LNSSILQIKEDHFLNEKVIFISDVHFGLENNIRENHKEEILVDFINKLENISHFIILGDLFDYWFEYKKVVQKGYYQLFAALKKLSEKGTKIIYLIGNHDFMHLDFFQTEFGTELIENSKEITFFGKKFYLAHGDGFNPNDKGYLFLKKIFRNKFAQKVFSYLHPDFALKLVSKTSKKSRDYTSKIDLNENEELIKFAKNKIDFGFDFVVFGHSHKQEFLQYKSGFYINLGTWLIEPNYGIYDGEKFEIIKLEIK